MAGVAGWYLDLAATSNNTFMPLYADASRYLVLKGGGGSGKSIFAGRKVIERAISEWRHRILVCRKVGKTLRESCFQQLLAQISEHYPDLEKRVNKTDMTITFPHNESQIIFTGLDDVEKLKSIHRITAIWIEEATELSESDFDQLDIRLRGKTTYYKQIILTFNPVSATHWIKRRFFDSKPKNCTTHESTYRDNRFLDAEQVAVLEAFKETDRYYYQVYCLGNWGTTGRSVFDAEKVSDRLAEGIKPIKTGYFTYTDTGLEIKDIAWIEDSQGAIRIYEDVKAGYPYVIGGDTAGEGSDAFVGQVLDNSTGRQVCILRQNYDEDVYAKQIYCLGMYYNSALIGIEANFSTYPIRELQRLKYPRQYVRETIDNYTNKPRQSYGYKTTSATRPVMLAELIKVVREDITLVYDETTLNEMLTFVYNEVYRPEAEDGAHDDTIMALAIAHQIRPQQDYLPKPEETAAVTWSKTMWEDYRNADASGKEYLISKWGKPKR